MGNVNMEAKQIHYRGGDKPMSVEEAIKEAGTSYVLPIASDETLGGVKVGTGLEIDAETGELSNKNPTPYTPFDFSTSEVNTGQKWIDGNDIYCKVVQTNITTSSAVVGDIKSGTVSLSDLIPGHDQVWFDTSMSSYIDTSENSKGFVSGYYDEGGDELLLLTFFARTDAPANLVLRYTKTA